MFETPTRNHFSLVFERAGAVLALVLAFAVSRLQDFGWEIFRPSFYIEMLSSASLTDNRNLIWGGLGILFMIWYLYISVRYWKKTTFYIDGVDFVFERKTMFRASSRLPIQNIAVVNIERSIFERLIGTAKVKIDLNSSRTAGSTDFKFVLRTEKARQLRDALMQIKHELTEEGLPADAESAVETPEEPRERVAYFTTAQALLHKLLFLPVVQSAASITVMFVLPQLDLDGAREMNRLWFLLLFAAIGWVLSVIRGTLNLGNYTVERDSSMIYIHCGVLNQRHYLFEIEKINAVMIHQPLLARFFGMASVDLAVVGFGNEKNETTHLALAGDMAQVQKILELCAPAFRCKEEPRRGHPVNLILTILRALVIGAGTGIVMQFMYRGAWILAAIVCAVALAGGVSEYLMRDYASDDNVIRYTGGTFNKRTCIFKYGDVQEVRIRTNIFLKPFRLARMKFSILAASANREHNTPLMDASLFERAAQQIVAHEDNILLGKYKDKRQK